MAKNEFFELFKGLTKEDFQNFGLFLQSPYFGAPKRLAKLYDIIEEKYEKLSSSPVSREEISKHFYPDEEFSSSQVNVRKLVSEFKGYYEKFLSQLEFSRQEFHRKLFLLKQLRVKERPEEFDKVFDQTNLMLENNTVKDEEYYSNKIKLLAEAYELEGSGFKKFEEDLAFKLQEIIDLFYIERKIFLFQRLESRDFVMNRQSKSYGILQNELIKYVTDNEEYFKNHTEIYYRFLTLKLFEDPLNSTVYNQYLEYIDYSENVLNVKCRWVYEDLINFFIRQVNLGRKEFDKRIFDLAVNMENKNMFLNYNIDYPVFKGIVEACIGEKQYNWAETFINKYWGLIDLRYREDLTNLSLAKIFFFKGEFLKSRNCLVKVKDYDFIFYIDSRLIQARIGYEEKQFNESLSVIDTVGKYLKSHKDIGASYKNDYKAFCQRLTNLIRLNENIRHGADFDFEKENMANEINSSIFVYGKKWLLNKIEEL